MQASVEIVSVAMAKEYLARALPNRPISETVVARYVADMADSLWINNGQPIVFSDAGELLDGQHRLSAIIKYGQPVSMMVVRGVPRQAFVTMDSGKPRKLPDVLGIEGYKYRFNLAACSRLCFNYIAGVAQSYTTSRGVLERFIKQHPYMAEMVDRVSSGSHKFPKTPLAAVLFLGNDSRRHDKAVNDFLQGIFFGENLWRGDARHTFREWHQHVVVADKHHSRSDAASLAMFGAIGRAWSAFASGRELMTIRNHYNATRETMELYGFDAALYSDVPDIAVKNREIALKNLRVAQKVNALTNAREAQAESRDARGALGSSKPAAELPKPVPAQAAKQAGAKAQKDARMRVVAKAMARAAR